MQPRRSLSPHPAHGIFPKGMSRLCWGKTEEPVMDGRVRMTLAVSFLPPTVVSLLHYRQHDCFPSITADHD